MRHHEARITFEDDLVTRDDLKTASNPAPVSGHHYRRNGGRNADDRPGVAFRRVEGLPLT
jgi:hypothetical protein